MKLPPFVVDEKTKWDRFKQFHINHGGVGRYSDYDTKFVQFSSGEFIVDTARFKPHSRKRYSEFNISVLLSSDHDFPSVTYPDGRPVIKSWLNYLGSNLCCIDHDTKRVVRIHYHPLEGVPQWINNGSARVYWPGPGLMPIGSEITVNETITPTREQRAHLREITHACKAWLELAQPDIPPTQKIWPTGPVNMPAGFSLSFATMTTQQRLQVANNGFAVWRKQVKVPYLLVA